MDDAFSALLVRWQTFYFTLAGVAATLTGLLFVAVALHLDRIIGKDRPELRLLAAQTFANFVFLVLIALFSLIPFPHSWGLGLVLVLAALLGGAGLVGIAPDGWQAARRVWRRRYVFWRLMLPGVGYFFVAIVGLALFAGNGDAFNTLAAPLLLLLGTCARNAWDLLLRVVEETPPPAGDREPQLHRLEQQLREVTRRQRQIPRQQEEAGRAAGIVPPRRRG
jgi:hypothetical protein